MSVCVCVYITLVVIRQQTAYIQILHTHMLKVLNYVDMRYKYTDMLGWRNEITLNVRIYIVYLLSFMRLQIFYPRATVFILGVDKSNILFPCSFLFHIKIYSHTDTHVACV